MDVLTDVLETVRVAAVCSGRFEFRAPWGFELGATPEAMFHAVSEGRCELEVVGVEERWMLEAGDVVALPRGHSHRLRDHRSSEVIPLRPMIGPEPCENGLVFAAGGSGPKTVILSGQFLFTDAHRHPLLTALPSVIHLTGQVARATPWFEMTLGFIASEAASNRPGARTVIGRLADILFIQIVRGYLGSAPEPTSGWLAALAHAQIGSALALVHQAPEQPWTVAGLAARVGMSRSAFAAHFTRLVGGPPLQYVTQWRMSKAASLLRNGRASLAEVAKNVGYDSETAFSKAFKRSVGHSPGAYRRALQAGFDGAN